VLTLTFEEESAVRTEIDRYLSDPQASSLATDLAAVARRATALPVYADMGGALLLAASGQILYVTSDQPWDENATWTLEADPRWTIVARIAACEQYPRLGFLRPKRPHGAVDCDACAGTGHTEIARIRLRCGRCWTLGWREPANPPVQPTGSAGG
jgi:hypothetical protein